MKNGKYNDKISKERDKEKKNSEENDNEKEKHFWTSSVIKANKTLFVFFLEMIK